MVPFIPLFRHLDAALEQTKPEKAPFVTMVVPFTLYCNFSVQLGTFFRVGITIVKFKAQFQILSHIFIFQLLFGNIAIYLADNHNLPFQQVCWFTWGTWPSCASSRRTSWSSCSRRPSYCTSWGRQICPQRARSAQLKQNEQKLYQFSITLVETFLIAFTIIKKDDDVTYSGLPSRLLLLQKDLILQCFLPWENSYIKKPKI